LAIAVVLVAVILIAPSFWAPVSLDEGFNLQIVGNLLHGHGYATNPISPSTQPHLFDYRVTTGPSLLLPIVAASAALGSHLWSYRLVPALFYALLLACWWRTGNRTAGTVGGVAAVGGVLMINGVVLAATEPGVALGESTSTACTMLALLALRYPGRCGALAGAAVMTKVVMVLALPGIILALLWQARRDDQRASRVLMRWSVWMVAPILLWQLVRISSVGWAGNLHADRDFLTFLRQDGSGSIGVLTHALQQLVTIQVAGVGVVLLSLMTVGAAWVMSPPTTRAWIRGFDPCLVGIAVSGLTLELWWLLSEGQGWPRHSLQASQLLLPLLLAMTMLALRTIRHVPLRRVLFWSIGCLVIVQVASVAKSEWFPEGPSLSDQRHVADLVGRQSHTYRFIGPDHYELSLLDPSLMSGPLTSQGGLLVVDQNHPGGSLKPCDRIVGRYAGYVLCWVDPSG
jgi:hypothetical protein